MQTKIPTYIISGFLGSGKTTVLKRMVEHARHQQLKVGLILNELGDVHVENYMFKQEQMVELLNGCICCSIQDDLKDTLQQFIDNPIDLLIIEGTGVANPNEIVDSLVSPPFHEHFDLKSIISLVDASNYLEYQSIFSSSKEIRQLLKEQISSATLLVINKTDLVSTKQLQKVEDSIKKELKDSTHAIKTAFGNVKMEELLLPRIQMISSIEKKSCSCSKHEECHHHTHHANIKAIKVTELPQFHIKHLQKWLRGLPPEVIRAKGIVQISGEYGLTSFQFAAKRITFEKLTEGTSQEPVIILIGNNLDQKNVMDYYENNLLLKT
ncbi:CobW family GTP-binding protein [Bacillus pinisoli]|uniref:CobW family GTP-binding protein n=1 Tax=Bacillus pinisoli TaxID=2901866 RepID=UPI001FF3286F|nr:GTP-binding protein [Bacillus pinisoli]